MHKKLRSLLALLLALLLCFGGVSPAAAVSGAEGGVPQPQADAQEAAPEAEASGGLLESLIRRKFGASQSYGPDDIVTVVVELESGALLDAQTNDGTAAISAPGSGELLSSQRRIFRQQDEVKAAVTALKDVQADFAGSERYTVVLNAFTVTVPYGQLERIRQLKGVKRVFVAGSFSVPELEPGVETHTAYSGDMIGLPAADALGYTGKGTLIAILDTGIQYDHEAFVTVPESGRYDRQSLDALLEEKADAFQAKISDGWGPDGVIYRDITASDVWRNGKIAYSFDYANMDADATADNSDHGIHVSGIAAGHTVQNGETTFRGVAPDAQLAVMKVFDSYTGQCEVTTLLSALEDCVLLDVDAINMSLGTTAGFDQDVTGILSEVLERINAAGIFLSVSSGNDGHTAASNPVNSAQLPSVENPDFGLAASPSTYSGALAVASVNNAQRLTPYLLINDRRVSFADTGSGPQAITSLTGTPALAAVPGLGAESDYEGVDVAGKVALIRRGELSFEEKIANAAAKGAVAALIFNNEDSPDLIGMSLQTFYIPSAFLTLADGEYALSLLNSGETVTLDASPDNKAWDTYAAAGQMSSFSSWGPTPMLAIKPEITAPGGSIYSSVAGGKYDSYSGTSMSSPHVAGAAALLTQYLTQEHGDIPKAERGRLIQSLIMSTADPIAAENGVPAPVRQQGAGLLDLEGALHTGAVLCTAGGGLPKAELGSSEDGLYTFSFQVKNLSKAPLTYTIHANVQTEAAYIEDGLTYFSTQPQDITQGAAVTIRVDGGIVLGDVDGSGAVDSADAWHVLRHVSQANVLEGAALAAADANGDGFVSREDAVCILRCAAGIDQTPGVRVAVPAEAALPVSVTIQLLPEQREALLSTFTTGTYIEGFVTLESQDEGGTDLGLPYLGYLGDWTAPAILDSTFFDGQDPMVAESGIVALNEVGEGNYLGFNYFTQTFDGDRIYFGPDAFDSHDRWSTYDTYLYSETSLLRNAAQVTYTVTDEAGNILYTTEQGPASKTYYMPSASAYAYTTDSTYRSGRVITWPEDGAKLTYTVAVTPVCDPDSTYTISYPFTIDSTPPSFTSEVRFNDETQHFEMLLTMEDNFYVQGAVICGIQEDQWGGRMYLEIADVSGAGIVDAQAGDAVTEIVDLNALQSYLAEAGCLLDAIQIQVIDYAWNIYSGDVELTGGHFITQENDDGTITIMSYQGLSSVLKIPQEIDGKTVTSIGPGAFRGAAVTDVTLPETLKSIGEGAFQGTNLTYVEIPDSVETIGEKAFGYDADGAKVSDFTMRVPEYGPAAEYAEENGFIVEYRTDKGLVYGIKEDGFVTILTYVGTDGHLEIPEQLHNTDVTEIGYRAFLDNAGITSVTLPDTLTKIGDRAFMRTSITSVDIPDSVTVIEEGAFSWLAGLTEIEVPAGVRVLPYMVFANDTSLASVTLHPGLEEIGDDVFSQTAITSIDLPDTVTKLGEACFQYCSSLKEITFSSALTEIGSSAFAFTGIENLVIPEGIVTIGANAFSDCHQLVSVHIPSTVTSLGGPYSGPFSSCNQLTTVTFADSEEPLTISSMSFSYCGALAEFEVPQRCVSIGSYAFSNCSALTELTLHEGLESIESAAFMGCSGLLSVQVPNSVAAIGDRALGYQDYSTPISGFTIHGYAGSAAEQYAEANSFAFEQILAP